MTVVVDARFLGHSGIGSYIAGILRHWPATVAFPHLIVRNQAQVDQLNLATAPAAISVLDAGMYSLAEQGPGLRRAARRAAPLWFPHYAHPWGQRGRWACTVHDVLHVAMPELFPGRLRRLAARALLSDVRDRAATIFFDSAFTAAEFTRLVGPPRGVSHTIGLGVDAHWALPTAPPPDWNGRPYVIALGNIKAHKGLSHLLTAMADPRLAELDVVLVGAATGLRTTDNAVLNAAAAMGSRCRWTGQVSDRHARAWVQHARVLAFPTLYEGFGLPPLEAMAAGVPVVASDIPPVRAACADAAVLVPPANSVALAEALVLVHRDQLRRQELIIAGHKRAARWTWNVTATATCAALADLQ